MKENFLHKYIPILFKIDKQNTFLVFQMESNKDPICFPEGYLSHYANIKTIKNEAESTKEKIEISLNDICAIELWTTTSNDIIIAFSDTQTVEEIDSAMMKYFDSFFSKKELEDI